MSNEIPNEGCLAGIDYGTVRVGVAVTDRERILASPHTNYTRQNAEADARWFHQFVDEEQIVGFVVGLPVHASGEESQKSREARQFGDWLRETTSLPVCYYDERYTSVQAEQILGAANLTKKKRKARLDMLAAQIMLSAFLESNQMHHEPGALDDDASPS